MDFIEIDGHFIRPFSSICVMFFFLRLFYFLRIFNSTSTLIKTILEITYDIRHFIFVLAIGTVGFGTTFYVLSNNNTDIGDNKQFIDDFV